MFWVFGINFLKWNIIELDFLEFRILELKIHTFEMQLWGQWEVTDNLAIWGGKIIEKGFTSVPTVKTPFRFF